MYGVINFYDAELLMMMMMMMMMNDRYCRNNCYAYCLYLENKNRASVCITNTERVLITDNLNRPSIYLFRQKQQQSRPTCHQKHSNMCVFCMLTVMRLEIVKSFTSRQLTQRGR